MKFFIRLGHLLLSYILRPVLFWVQTSVHPDSLKEFLELGDSPVIYVLPKRSIIDYLVLLQICRRYGLPEPDLGLDFTRKRRALCLFLEKTGPIKRIRKLKPSHVLLHIVQQAGEKTGMKAQIIPVSPFWGKDPGNTEPSLFKLIFNDDEDAGWLQKFFIVVAQGRNNNVHFGKPFTIEKAVDDNNELSARKIRRILRIHFRRVRGQVLGQKLYNREQVITRITRARLVQQEIEREAKGNPQKLRDLDAAAIRYARELSADQIYSMVRTFEIVLGKLWNRLFSGVEVVNPEIPNALAAEDYEIVYVPTHRSHLDYLLVNYTVFHSGLPSPHTAAGINLNFFPMGWFLRRTGAFFIRRSFRGNRIYTAVVEEYIAYLLTHGYPISFFPEGGRSRTGRPLPLKTGMLAMVVKSFVRNYERPIAIVPVYIGYDKVMEVKSYLKELSGGAKKKESMFQLLGARKLLKMYYGKAYLSYGEPIILSRFLDATQPDWKAVSDSKPEWLSAAVNDLSQQVSKHLNEAAVITPISLVGLALLASNHKALPLEELQAFIEKMIELNNRLPYHANVKVMSDNFAEILDSAQKLKAISLYQHAAGDVAFVNDVDAALISYYRNNIAHIFTIPALIARFFHQQEEMYAASLFKGCAEIYAVLSEETLLRWKEYEVEEVVQRYADVMVEMGLLRKVGDYAYRRPAPQSDESAVLDTLSQVMGVTFDRFMITAVLLAKHAERGLVNSEEFLLQCERMGQRFAILGGLNNPEISDKTFIQKHIQLLKKKGLLITVDENSLRVDPRVSSLAQYAKSLLSSDAHRSIERIFRATMQEKQEVISNVKVEVPG
ncbi:MAG: glycerol-3-phosphate 1-O-acyltransferase PlsB [Proteobacteria bacterium]|nr:MAG: glycerol-3-phosphate 1-O-acyltransferase PlsB [Pseudomonadota bacterium]